MQKLVLFFLAIMLLVTLGWSYTIPAQASNGNTGAATDQPCENKVLSSGTLTGQFLGIECGDSCFVAIKKDNGEEILYFADGDVQDFDAPIGTKVLINFNIEQINIEEETCIQDGVAYSIERVK
jgi:hypothetical protein